MKLPRGDVAITLGSGLGSIAESLVGGHPIPYTELGDIPTSGVTGHPGSLYRGRVADKDVLVFAGRVHLYEGHDAQTVTAWVRAAVEAGCKTLVITNAAGGISPQLDPGTPCLISDHLNLTGRNPLVGPNDDSVGPRFPDMTAAYDADLRRIARSVDPQLKEGVYAGLLGPVYETPAEVRMLRTLGADLVGMSTVLETIMARYLDARVLGISIVTNLAAGISDSPLSHEEVAAGGRAASDRLTKLLSGFLEKL